ncbi:DUF5924 family protein [Cellvibrio sp. PSBB006]|uniref:DUF5924 family protein n=1 Tax=Cellvibrio sp. PSBB006 TaxID=1987723 RepID=UPI001E2965C7|nr:DUF5924 family protein [Cellvibrio sp. PSBB006]
MMRPLVASSMNVTKMVVLQCIALVTRFPWAVAIFGFVSGVASFLLVEREQEKFAQIVSALMLLSWGWLALENLLQRSVSSWFGFKLPPPLLSFATQLVHQESLFFVVPFFFITTVWNGGQMVFTSLLIIAAFISIVDPIYYRWLAARRWLYFIFHGVTLFAVLLTALPIIFQLPTPKSYLLSLGIAILLSLPGIVRALPFNWWKRSLLTITGIVIVAIIGVSVRAWIPPATLRLTEVAVTDRIDDRNRSPENSLKVISVDQLRSGLYAYTAIRAPRGLNERIYHVWRRNGRIVDKIALDISGGREAGYRAWTHKLNFPPYPSGRWQIHVVTEANQVIGILRFQVVESTDEVIVEDDDMNPVEKIRAVLPEDLIPLEQLGGEDKQSETDGDQEETGVSEEDISGENESAQPAQESEFSPEELPADEPVEEEPEQISTDGDASEQPPSSPSPDQTTDDSIDKPRDEEKDEQVDSSNERVEEIVEQEPDQEKIEQDVVEEESITSESSEHSSEPAE